MNKTVILLTTAGALALSGCVGHQTLDSDKTRDRGIIGSDSLQEMSAGIWVDPRGCDHWIIDDGVEGYLSARLGPDGRPVCSGVAPPEYVVGPFKGTQNINDPL